MFGISVLRLESFAQPQVQGLRVVVALMLMKNLPEDESEELA